jgi:hypothetical protein
MPFFATVESTCGYGRPYQAPAATGGGGTGPSGTMRVNIVGDSSVATFVSGLTTARTALGYSNVTMTYTQTALNNYTGSNLSTANFDAVVVWTNGGITFNSSFGTNLNSYITSGGPVIFGVFCWGNVSAITNFTYTNSPYVFKGSQANQVATMTKTVTHPITSNISTAITVSATFHTPTVSVQPTATSIATFPDGTSMVAYQTSPRRVAVNLYPITNTANSNQLFLNAILWAGGLLN